MRWKKNLQKAIRTTHHGEMIKRKQLHSTRPQIVWLQNQNRLLTWIVTCFLSIYSLYHLPSFTFGYDLRPRTVLKFEHFWSHIEGCVLIQVELIGCGAVTSLLVNVLRCICKDSYGELQFLVRDNILKFICWATDSETELYIKYPLPTLDPWRLVKTLW